MKSSLTGKSRNSSIEVLRLVSMLMIVGFHYVIASSDADWLSRQPIGTTKFMYQFVFMGGGWVGNFIFFTISVWFLLGRDLSLTDSLRRIWIMERELLFWSITLFCVLIIGHGQGWYTESLLGVVPKTVLPLLTDMWWYPTSYALFLLLLPFLTQGMKALGKKRHRQLAICLFVVWGLLAMIPYPEMPLDLDKSGVFVFLYWFILLSYYRWYMSGFSDKQCLMLIMGGLAIEALYWIGTNVLFEFAGKKPELQVFIFDHWKLPTMMIGFGLFLLCERHAFHSKIVNCLASSAFGIYLIHYQPNIYRLWSNHWSLRQMYESSHPILMGAIVIFGVFSVCLALDLVRQLLFAITVNRRPGKWFDKLSKWYTSRSSRRSMRYAADR